MSIRTRDVPPSAQIELEGPDGPQVWPVVTQEDLIKALADAAIVVDMAGGCVSLVVTRIPTTVPNEMVTTRALVTWQDRTNAKPQPEATTIEEEPIAAAENGDVALPIDDGLRVDPEAVDESDVPAELRS